MSKGRPDGSKKIERGVENLPYKKQESILQLFLPVIVETREEDPYSNLVCLFERIQKSGYVNKIIPIQHFPTQLDNSTVFKYLY